jgi:excisionase family DNA binding protein
VLPINSALPLTFRAFQAGDSAEWIGQIFCETLFSRRIRLTMATRKKNQQPDTQKRNLATVMDVCRWLKISRTKLYSLMDAGRVRYIKIGRCVRIREAEVDRFIAGLEAA